MPARRPLKRDPRPDLNKVPKISSVRIRELPEDHTLTALAYIAASAPGLTAEHRRLLLQPGMTRFAPILTKLHRKARTLHGRGGAAVPLQVQQLVDIALVDLAELCIGSQVHAVHIDGFSTTSRRTIRPAA